MEPVLVAKNLSKKYGRVVALDNSDLELYPGEVLGVIGDNGAGKSTLIKVICGAVIPDSGEILINNRPINKIDLFERARLIQPIFQDPYSTLNPNHTIGYVISRPLIIQKRYLPYINIQSRESNYESLI